MARRRSLARLSMSVWRISRLARVMRTTGFRNMLLLAPEADADETTHAVGEAGGGQAERHLAGAREERAPAGEEGDPGTQSEEAHRRQRHAAGQSPQTPQQGERRDRDDGAQREQR